MFERTALIGLGSNLRSWAGSPRQTLQAGVARIRRLGEITAQSAFYETQPVGMRDQPTFLNAAVALRTGLEPPALLDTLLELEREFGRDRLHELPKGPRTLDLDLLMMNGLVLATEALMLPHPAMASRRFVLAPLAEIAPEARHPLLGKTIAELLAELPDAGENRRDAVRLQPTAQQLDL